MSDGNRRRITIPREPHAELAAVPLVDLLGERLGFSHDTLAEIKLAVVEACLNALEYGQGAVEVEVVAFPEEQPARLEITVTDHGGGFDAREVPQPNLQAKLHAARKRGWGIELMRHLMDEVEVNSAPGLTRVRLMRKRKEA